MQKVIKQHYIPVFYLKRWAINGKLVEFSRPNPKSRDVKPHMKPPKATAWCRGLYDLAGISPKMVHYIEQIFFLGVDTRASMALEIIEDGGQIERQELRQAWAMFVMSLFLRHPKDVDAFKEIYKKEFLISSDIEREKYARLKSSSDPDEFSDYIISLGPNFIENMALNHIPKIINSQRSVESLMNMTWGFVSAPRDGYFLTSDRPLIRNLLGRPDSLWLLPISPRKSFIAVNLRGHFMETQANVYRQGWKQINKLIVRQAEALGFSDSQRHLPFFQKHLAKDTKMSVFYSLHRKRS